MKKLSKITFATFSALTILFIHACYSSNCNLGQYGGSFFRQGPPHWRTKFEDLARQRHIDHWFNSQIGEINVGGIDLLLQEKEHDSRKSYFDQIIIENDLEMLEHKLEVKEAAIADGHHQEIQLQNSEKTHHHQNYPQEVIEQNQHNQNEPKVVVLSACDQNHDSQLLQMALQNRDEYARMHGYTHHFVQLDKFVGSDKSVVWLKIPAILEALEKYPEAEWIWWLDMDAIIMNLDVKLSDHLLRPSQLASKLAYNHPLRNISSRFEGHVYPSQEEVNVHNIDMIISQDSLGINAGSFFLRRSDFTSLLLDLWADPALMVKNWERQEQDALIHLLLTHKSLLGHVGLVPQRLINAYHDASMSHLWRYRSGDFVVHFAGPKKPKSHKSLWKSYWVERSTGLPST